MSREMKPSETCGSFTKKQKLKIKCIQIYLTFIGMSKDNSTTLLVWQMNGTANLLISTMILVIKKLLNGQTHKSMVMLGIILGIMVGVFESRTLYIIN